MRIARYFGLLLGTLIGGFGLFCVAFALLGRAKGSPGPLYACGAVFALFGAVIIGSLELQAARLRAAHRAIDGTIAAIAARLFDAPARVLASYDGTALMGAFGGYSTALDGANFAAAEGTARGAHLLVASHPSVVGRQALETYHVYSYVAVDVPGVWTTFLLSEQGGMTKFFSKLGVGRDVELGDAAFDQAFIVDADPAVARHVLDAATRARLVLLRGQVPLVSQDVGAGRMSIGLGARGLCLRWPGELSVEFAAELRDLLLEMRARLMQVPAAR